MLPVNTILQGNALDVLKTLPDESIDCAITSPPYWALRQNIPEGHPDKKYEIGLEPDFKDYIKKLTAVFEQVKRVLKKQSTCWVVLGDTYYTKSGSGFRNDNLTKNRAETHYGLTKANELRGLGLLPEKSLCLIPQRFAIAMQETGWIIRNIIIWHKPNCLPSSIKDRFSVDFEVVLFMVKSRKYYFKQQFEPLQQSSINRAKYKSYSEKTAAAGIHGGMTLEKQAQHFEKIRRGEITMRNRRAIWTIPVQPFHGNHFSTYPRTLVEILIRAGCPRGGVVLDPFIGSGTTGVVAKSLSRNFLGIELSRAYITLAQSILNQK